MTTWVYEQAEPTSTYLITLQIGVYARHRMAKNGVEIFAVLPDRLRQDFDHDFGRQPQMMKLFVKLFGPYPLADGYTVVVTDDDLEIPLEAQGISIFGANHCDGAAERGTADRARTGPPVVRQLGDRAALARTSGCMRVSPATRSGCGRRTAVSAVPTNSPVTTTNGWPTRRRTSCSPTPAPATCSTTGYTNAERSPCTLCAMTIGDDQFLCVAEGLDGTQQTQPAW